VPYFITIGISSVRRTLNKKTGNDTQIKFCKAMDVRILINGSEIWAITPPSKNIKIQEEKI
jgi:hypothetical protein